ncbi:MAG: hypothetical protein RL115_858 [Bacteroidota bacterium]|jgi:glycosyltransferase involved in cell wall biosynthesis
MNNAVNNLPLISIIIPCYNHGKYLEETLNSIKPAKGDHNYEIIVINDGSTDLDTLAVFKKLEEEGYFILHQNNQGLGAARNNGIKIAKGKYILPLDSDNRICKPYLTTAIDILEKNQQLSIVYSDHIRFGEVPQHLIKVNMFNQQKLMLNNYIDACAVYRKSLWEEMGGYDDKMPVMGFEDWEFWLKSSFAGKKFYYLEEVGFEYRVLKNSMSNTTFGGRYEEIMGYLSNKHKEYMEPQHIEQRIVDKLTLKKISLLKLCLKVVTPRLYKWLLKRQFIKVSNVFN